MPAHGGNSHNTHAAAKTAEPEPTWEQIKLNTQEQLIAFEAVDCGYCRQFDKEVLSDWKNPVPIVSTNLTTPPRGWKLNRDLFATPTIVLFRNRQEVARYTGYHGVQPFWAWMGNETGSTQVP
jgi:peptide methionine sulfoxide reductase msrA/msrB